MEHTDPDLIIALMIQKIAGTISHEDNKFFNALMDSNRDVKRAWRAILSNFSVNAILTPGRGLDTDRLWTEPKRSWWSKVFRKTKKQLPKLIIILEAGEVQVVYSNTDVQYALIDYDRKGTEQNPVLGVFETETVECDLKELFNPGWEGGDSSSEYKRIYQELVRLPF